MDAKVYLFGTFDVDNYGDLLFPVVARWRLGSDLIPVSPTNNITSFDCIEENHPISFEQYHATTCQGALIGGGNIVRFSNSYVFPYNGKPFSYAGLQFYPIAGSISYNFPVIYNSPSITATRPNFIYRYFYRICFRSSDYLSFRDRRSVDLAKKLTKKKVYFVPDTAFDINRIWPCDPLVRPLQEEYFVVHVNSRYGGDASCVAKEIDLICNKTEMKAVFLPIGPCHGDKEYARLVAGMMKYKPVIVENLSLKTFALFISNSTFYIGSSMHGFITALAYRVKAGLVLNSVPMAKFQGVLECAKLPDFLVFSSWGDVLGRLNDIPVIEAEALALIHRELDQHWERVQQLLLTGVQIKKNSYRSIKYWKVLILISQTVKKIWLVISTRTLFHEEQIS